MANLYDMLYRSRGGVQQPQRWPPTMDYRIGRDDVGPRIQPMGGARLPKAFGPRTERLDQPVPPRPAPALVTPQSIDADFQRNRARTGESTADLMTIADKAKKKPRPRLMSEEGITAHPRASAFVADLLDRTRGGTQETDYLHELQDRIRKKKEAKDEQDRTDQERARATEEAKGAGLRLDEVDVGPNKYRRPKEEKPNEPIPPGARITGGKSGGTEWTMPGSEEPLPPGARPKTIKRGDTTYDFPDPESTKKPTATEVKTREAAGYIWSDFEGKFVRREKPSRDPMQRPQYLASIEHKRRMLGQRRKDAAEAKMYEDRLRQAGDEASIASADGYKKQRELADQDAGIIESEIGALDEQMNALMPDGPLSAVDFEALPSEEEGKADPKLLEASGGLTKEKYQQRFRKPGSGD